MRSSYKFITFFMLLLIFILAITAQHTLCEPQTEKPIVVCTTSVLYSIVKDLAGDSVEAVMIVTPSVCPAHYDIKPGDVETMAKAQLVLYHGFEPWINSLVEASGTKAHVVKIGGPWNTPDYLKEKYEAVANCLQEYLGIDVSSRLEKCLAAIDKTANELKAEAAEIEADKVNVVCMTWVKGFVSWLGFNVIADYGPPEKLSTAQVDELIQKSRDGGAILVIDNLQSGTRFGEYLSSELGLVHVVLTNFPYTEPELVNCTMVMERNAKALFDAVSTYKHGAAAVKLESELSLWKTISFALVAIALIEGFAIAFLWRKLGK